MPKNMVWAGTADGGQDKPLFVELKSGTTSDPKIKPGMALLIDSNGDFIINNQSGVGVKSMLLVADKQHKKASLMSEGWDHGERVSAIQPRSGDRVNALVVMSTTPAKATTSSITVGGTASAAGNVTVTVGGVTPEATKDVAIADGDTAANVGTKITNALNNDDDFPISVTGTSPALTFVSKKPGGNAYTVKFAAVAGVTGLPSTATRFTGGVDGHEDINVGDPLTFVGSANAGHLVKATKVTSKGSSFARSSLDYEKVVAFADEDIRLKTESETSTAKAGHLVRVRVA